MSFKSETTYKSSLLDSIMDWLEVVVFAVFSVVLVFSFLVKLFVVEGPSMNFTLNNGDRLLVTNYIYTPKQGDIVVVYSEYLKKNIVKRVVALEGQTVVIDYNEHEILVDGVVLQEKYTGEFMEDTGLFDMNFYDEQDGVYRYQVPEGCIFLLGDNRNRSTDSRTIGFVPEEDVLGKVFFRLSSPTGKVGIIN